jgi:hypothetical protein
MQDMGPDAVLYCRSQFNTTGCQNAITSLGKSPWSESDIINVCSGWAIANVERAQTLEGSLNHKFYSRMPFISGKFEQHRLFKGNKRPSVWHRAWSVLGGVSACLMVIGALLLVTLRLQPWRASGYLRVNQEDLFDEELLDEEGLEPPAE